MQFPRKPIRDGYPNRQCTPGFVHGFCDRAVGYRVSRVRIEDGKVVSYEPFAQGWLKNERAWGRPAYLRVAPDGSLLVSDDKAGAIYRIRYRP